jgi:membrane-associated phospholipid phosphatase
MTQPQTPPAPSAARPSHERRVRARERFRRVWNLIYRGLRSAGRYAHTFYGLVGIFLITGAFIAVVATLSFSELGEHVLKGGTQPFDVAVLSWLHAHHTPLLDAIMDGVTPLGTGSVVVVVVGVASLFLWHTEHKVSARLLLAATVGNILLNGVLKLIYHRPRPTLFEWQTTAVSSSFPSGHAMSATVVYGTVAYLVIRLQTHHWSRVLTGSAAVLIVLLICLSRLYLGVHYPSDVIGGIIVGLAWAAFCMATLEASIALTRHRAPRDVADELPAAIEVAASM